MKKREPEALWRVGLLLTQLVGRQLTLPVGSVRRVRRVGRVQVVQIVRVVRLVLDCLNRNYFVFFI